MTDAWLKPVLEVLPLEQAMSALVVARPVGGPAAEVVSQLVKRPEIAARPSLVAALWLYVDDLDRSHRVSQQIGDATGAYWHGIMHRREGDFSNSHYWFRRVGRHPALALVGDDYDGPAFIDQVEAAHRRGECPPELVDVQRREWLTLWRWCTGQGLPGSSRGNPPEPRTQ